MIRSEFLKMSFGMAAFFNIKNLIRMNNYNPKYSLSQWALHRSQFGTSKNDYEQWKKNLVSNPDANLQGVLHPLDFPKKAHDLGYNAVEYVNTFFFDKANNQNYLSDLNKRCSDYDIKSVLIMVDEEGFIGHSDKKTRTKAVENHKKWIEASAKLSCPFMRLNAHGIGSWEDQLSQTAESLSELCRFAKSHQIEILIENHGGLSSHPDWLIQLIKKVDVTNLGVMLDTDNFDYSDSMIWGAPNRYNRYEGVKKLLPYSKSVSVKTHHFDHLGEETSIDYEKMTQLISESNFNKWISVEFEGDHFSEEIGIQKTRQLLEKHFAEK